MAILFAVFGDRGDVTGGERIQRLGLDDVEHEYSVPEPEDESLVHRVFA